MKLVLISITFQLLYVFTAFGKVEFQLDGCAVESVITSEEKIVFIVSGKCNFTVVKQSDQTGDAVDVVSELTHTTVIIRRYSTKEDPALRKRDWNKLCEAAASLHSKKMWMDCSLVNITVEDAHINFVSCLAARFGEEHADEAGSQDPWK